MDEAEYVVAMSNETDPRARPPWVKPRIVAAPKIRQIYWCEFWSDAHLPEMWKVRPAIVISYKNMLHGPCLIIPTSSEPQGNNKWAVKLETKIESNVESWAICNQPSTVSPSRFQQFRGEIPILPKTEFNQVLERLMKWLPVPFVIEK